jgi:hypothetical protein
VDLRVQHLSTSTPDKAPGGVLATFREMDRECEEAFQLNGSHASGGNTNFRHGHRLDLDMEVGTFINDDTSLTFLGNIERWSTHFGRRQEKQTRRSEIKTQRKQTKLCSYIAGVCKKKI